MKQILYVACAAIVGAAAIGCDKKAETDPDGWQLVWAEEFDTPELDTTVWTRISRGPSDWNNYMTTADTCYSWSDGNLVLRGIAAYEGDGDTAAYLTGGIFTKNKKAFENGRISIRAKLQAGKGAWPAFWMLPQAQFEGDTMAVWPNGGEIDIMERLNHDSIAYQTVHTYYTKRLGLDSIPPHYNTGAIIPDDYNVFSVEMYADSLRFFINDSLTFVYPRIETELPGQFPFPDRPFYLLLDMQLGGAWVGEVDPAEVPNTMLIDWVRFYQKKK